MGSLVLDFLLVIIFLMMVPIGFYRGGLREVCVSGGLMLGILMSQEWGETWSDLFVRLFDLSQGGAAFLMSVLITFGITGLLGYGGSASFNSRPGPGGRLYGAYLALFNAMIVAGYLINLYAEYIVPASNTEPVTSGIIARSLSEGFGSVLLIATIGVGFATVFGMFLRERTDDVADWQPPATTTLYNQPAATRPYNTISDEQEEKVSSEPVRILEVKSWEEKEEAARPDPTTYGSGWRQTWPAATPAQKRRVTKGGTKSTGSDSGSRSGSGSGSESSSGKNVLADWMKDQDES